ncbi:MAG TPA: hybrid sensor histidine kinase/response regulator [Polyangia bacterium]
MLAPSILVVDDTPANLQMLADMLKRRGYRARPVPSGRLALLASKADPPDLILLDVNMPDMDGYAVCTELKKDESLAAIPVIFISAYGETVDKMRAFSAGGLDYITKPFHVEEVEARVAIHLQLSQQRRELETLLAKQRELEGMRDSMVHMIVHDLRAPLTAVFNYLDLVREQEAGFISPDSIQNLDLAMKASRWMVQMVNVLLDASKIESGRMNLKIAECDVGDVLSDAIDAIRSLADEKNVLCHPAHVRAAIDRDAVARVVQNLVTNAVKLTPPGGDVQVTLQSKGEVLRVEVTDQGPGIATEHHPKIFEKFGQLDTNVRQSIPSSGLGLYFCKLAVEAHGGRIGVDSEVGQGSTFWFELPLRGPATNDFVPSQFPPRRSKGSSGHV